MNKDLKDEFQQMMIDLAACRVSPEEWSAWWAAHDAFLQEFLNRGEYLRIKPSTDTTRWCPISKSQKGAVQYLQNKGVPVHTSNDYQENWEKEMDEFCKQQRKKEKELLEMLKTQCPQLFSVYPRFAKSLKNAFLEGDTIEPGLSEMEIKSGSYALPPDIEGLFKTVSVISLDGISIDCHELRSEVLCGQEYLVLGEFWKDADGDLLLIELNETALPTPIYYYCHEVNKVKKLCNNIDELMEKQMSSYNRNKS
ncbi:MAG: SMI1/KNR4 family protein [Peptococcaceae bacterium]|nr:SMI1/KNR4 family protein [Peptococcaceae bacterium]